VLVIAGWATTANMLAWLAERLSRAPAALARCLEDADAGTHRYLTATVQETLRMRPPVPFTVRYAVRDVELGTLRIPQGTAVAVDIERIHHRPEIYPDPGVFRPERFLKTRQPDHRPRRRRDGDTPQTLRSLGVPRKMMPCRIDMIRAKVNACIR
jgi:cytochrome P450 family 135